MYVFQSGLLKKKKCIPEWNGDFDESLAEEGMGGIYDEAKSKVVEIVFEDYVSDDEEVEFEFVHQPMGR